MQAAPPGWRLLSIFGERREVLPIAVWLLQEKHHYTYPDSGGESILTPPSSDLEVKVGPETRVIPGVSAEGWNWEVNAIDIEGSAENWKVLGPGEADPIEDEWEAEISRRRS